MGRCGGWENGEGAGKERRGGGEDEEGVETEGSVLLLLLTHVMSSVEKLIMVGMKFSLMRMDLMDFQSLVASPMSRQILSMAILTILGGFTMDLTSTSCCFLMDLTAAGEKDVVSGKQGGSEANSRNPKLACTYYAFLGEH